MQLKDINSSLSLHIQFEFQSLFEKMLFGGEEGNRAYHQYRSQKSPENQSKVDNSFLQFLAAQSDISHCSFETLLMAATIYSQHDGYAKPPKFIELLETLSNQPVPAAHGAYLIAVKQESLKKNIIANIYEQSQQLAAKNDAYAQSILGHMYHYNRGIPPQELPQKDKTSVGWYRKAAEQGNAIAQCNLGYMYEHGHGIPPEELPQKDEIALEWYLKAAAQGNTVAQCRIGFLNQKGQKDAIAVEWYRKAAEKGNAIAQFYLSCMYQQGCGISPLELPQKDENAVEWCRRAAEQGLAMAQYTLGFLYEQGLGISPLELAQKDEKAVEWYRKAVAQGEVNAQSRLGCLYLQGRGISSREMSQKDEMAFELFLKAAPHGDVVAEFGLGFIYEHGRGITSLRMSREDQDEKAVEWYRKAAAKRLARAQNRLGCLYREGRGIFSLSQKDHMALPIPEEFQPLFEKMLFGGEEGKRAYQEYCTRRCQEDQSQVELDNSFLQFLAAQSNIENCSFETLLMARTVYCQKDGYTKPPKFIELLEALSNQPVPAAHGAYLTLSPSLQKKNILTNIYEQSLNLAAKNNPAAQGNLGCLYQQDLGIPPTDRKQRYEKAVEWYCKAAVQGDAFAQNNLGQMYKNGLGISSVELPIKDELAIECFRLAAAQDNTAAQYNLGFMYEENRGVSSLEQPQKDEKAVEWYRIAAAKGNVHAQFALGFMYHRRRGISSLEPQHAEKAVEWYRRAAVQGYPAAQCNLGHMSVQGLGISPKEMRQKDEIAVEWFRKAAEQGDAAAQHALRCMSQQVCELSSAELPQKEEEVVESKETFEQALTDGKLDAYKRHVKKLPEYFDQKKLPHVLKLCAKDDNKILEFIFKQHKLRNVKFTQNEMTTILKMIINVNQSAENLSLAMKFNITQPKYTEENSTSDSLYMYALQKRKFRCADLLMPTFLSSNLLRETAKIGTVDLLKRALDANTRLEGKEQHPISYEELERICINDADKLTVIALSRKTAKALWIQEFGLTETKKHFKVKNRNPNGQDKFNDFNHQLELIKSYASLYARTNALSTDDSKFCNKILKKLNETYQTCGQKNLDAFLQDVSIRDQLKPILSNLEQELKKLDKKQKLSEEILIIQLESINSLVGKRVQVQTEASSSVPKKNKSKKKKKKNKKKLVLPEASKTPRVVSEGTGLYGLFAQRQLEATEPVEQKKEKEVSVESSVTHDLPEPSLQAINAEIEKNLEDLKRYVINIVNKEELQVFSDADCTSLMNYCSTLKQLFWELDDDLDEASPFYLIKEQLRLLDCSKTDVEAKEQVTLFAKQFLHKTESKAESQGKMPVKILENDKSLGFKFFQPAILLEDINQFCLKRLSELQRLIKTSDIDIDAVHFCIFRIVNALGDIYRPARMVRHLLIHEFYNIERQDLLQLAEILLKIDLANRKSFLAIEQSNLYEQCQGSMRLLLKPGKREKIDLQKILQTKIQHVVSNDRQRLWNITLVGELAKQINIRSELALGEHTEIQCQLIRNRVAHENYKETLANESNAEVICNIPVRQVNVITDSFKDVLRKPERTTSFTL